MAARADVSIMITAKDNYSDTYYENAENTDCIPQRP